MMEEKLIALLESVLGKGRRTSGDNYAFYSPFKQHHKQKLEVNVRLNKEGKNPWHCWISDEKGQSVKSLFKKIGVSKQVWERHNEIFQKRYRYKTGQATGQATDQVKLPDEYQPLWKDSNSLIRKHALRYLLKRGLTIQDIIKYSIGYCETGAYMNKIVIPSYDENGMLNYFVSRAFYDETIKHKNPDVSKDIIGFDLYINWNLPIIICEGAFDAIAIRNNAIPLFGKHIQKKLKLKILEKKVEKIYLVLDSDAIDSAMKIAEEFSNNGIKVHLVRMNEDEDPSELGTAKITELINNSEEYNFNDLLRHKLMNI